MPDKVAVTANLSIQYRAPTRADQFVLIKTKIIEKAGRKIKVAGSIESLDGTILCEAQYVYPVSQIGALTDLVSQSSVCAATVRQNDGHDRSRAGYGAASGSDCQGSSCKPAFRKGSCSLRFPLWLYGPAHRYQGLYIEEQTIRVDYGHNRHVRIIRWMCA